MIAAVNVFGYILTDDEQGCNVTRSVAEFIAHAANRHASRVGGRFYLNIH